MPDYKVKCLECGAEYTAKVHRNGFCDKCKAIKTSEARHKYYNKRKANGGNLTDKPHIQICEVCGKKFETAGFQKKCSFCARKHNIKQNNDYRNSHTDSLSLRLPTGVRDEMKELANVNGLSLTSLLMRSYYHFKEFLELSPADRERILSIMKHKASVDDEHKK